MLDMHGSLARSTANKIANGSNSLETYAKGKASEAIFGCFVWIVWCVWPGWQPVKRNMGWKSGPRFFWPWVKVFGHGCLRDCVLRNDNYPTDMGIVAVDAGQIETSIRYKYAWSDINMQSTNVWNSAWIQWRPINLISLLHLINQSGDLIVYTDLYENAGTQQAKQFTRGMRTVKRGKTSISSMDWSDFGFNPVKLIKIKYINKQQP